MLLYAKSLQELERMTEILIEELAAVGLILNAGKTNILQTAYEDDRHDIDYVEVGKGFIRILHAGQVHRYLGRHLSLDPRTHIDQELAHRRQQAWYAFNKHKRVLLNNHVSLKKRLYYFDACITPAILFGLSGMPMRSSDLESLHILQTEILCRIVGWRRKGDES